MNENKELLVFSAPWCTACQPYKKTLNDVSLSGESIQVIDVDADPETAAKYQIRGVPTSILLVDNVVHRRKTGSMQLDQLKEFIKI